MNPSPRQCRETIKRVNAKIGHLKRSITKYHSSSHRIVSEDNLDRGERLYRLADVREPPSPIAIQVTEIVSLMRTALDHLMYLLIGPLPEDQNAPGFPILKDEAEFDKKLGALAKKHALPANVIQWLKSLQGYSEADPKTRVLGQLNSLAGISKHRFHNEIVVQHQRTQGKLIGVSGISHSHRVDNNVFNGVAVGAFEILKPKFEDGQPVARVALASRAGGGLVLGRGANMTLGGTGASFATYTSPGPVKSGIHVELHGTTANQARCYAEGSVRPS